MDQNKGHRSLGTQRPAVGVAAVFAVAAWLGFGSQPVNAQNRDAPDPPSAEVVGCRYVALTPEEYEEDIALGVIGAAYDPPVDCVSAYVQSNGTLGSTAYYQSVEDWGTVYVRGFEVIPEVDYTFKAIGETSGPGPAFYYYTTWMWGDLDHDNDVDFDDINCAVDMFRNQSNPDPDCTMYSADVCGSTPCIPDGCVYFNDIAVVADAFRGMEYTDYCDEPCE